MLRLLAARGRLLLVSCSAAGLGVLAVGPGTEAPAQEAGGRPAAQVRAGEFLIQAVPLDPVRPLRVLDNSGPVTLFEGRCGVELVLTGEAAGALPDLGAQVMVRTDAGEDAAVAVEPGEVTRQPNGRRFTGRFRLDLSRLRQPFQLARLQGEICETLPLETVTHRVHLSLADGLSGRQLGPLRVGVTVAPSPGGPTATAVCEWEATAPGGGLAAGEVAGPVTADLFAAGQGGLAAPCPLVHTVLTTGPAAGGAAFRREQKFVWRVGSATEAEVALTYPTIPRRRTRFVLEGVPVPAPGPPVMARIAAQRLVLGAPGEDAQVDPLDPEQAPPGAAPHPLLVANGGAIRFQLRIAGRPAGEGAVQAALSPRRGREWGGWHWFRGATDGRGEALLANLCPGGYRLRLRFRPVGYRGPEYQAADRELAIATGSTAQTAVYDLVPASG
jgi:hypothetical protein